MQKHNSLPQTKIIYSLNSGTQVCFDFHKFTLIIFLILTYSLLEPLYCPKSEIIQGFPYELSCNGDTTELTSGETKSSAI